MPEEKKDMSQKELGKLAIEIWKLEKRLKKIENLDEEEQKATNFLLNRINKIIEGYDVKIVDYTGQKFLEGMTGIDILSAETDKDLEFPIIGDTVTPAIEIEGIIVQRAKVVIKTPETVVEENPNEEKNKEIEETIKGKETSTIIDTIILIAVIILIGLIWYIYSKLIPRFLDYDNETDNLHINNIEEVILDTGDIEPQKEIIKPNIETGDIVEIIQNESSGENSEDINLKIYNALSST